MRLYYRMIQKMSRMALLLSVGVSACCAQPQQRMPISALSEALEVCSADYRETYLKGRTVTNKAQMLFDQMSREEVLRSDFARQCSAEMLTEPMYIHISFSHLPKNAVGGRAHYLVNPETGKIVARYHTR